MFPTVLVTRRWPAPVERLLRDEFAAQLSADDHPMTAAELGAALRHADIILPTVSDTISGPMLRVTGRRAQAIVNYGAGVDHIDIASARELGITVTNTPDVLTECAADLTLTLILMVCRRAGEGERELRAGRWGGWRPTHLLGHRVSGRTLGIIGLGRIGRAVARRARDGFGMKVIAHTRTPRAEEGLELRDGLDDILREADIVSLHVPATAQTLGMIDSRRLALMRPGAYLINTARGGLVDEQALVGALRSGALGGAGLDVYAAEPAVHPGLLPLENVVLLPHLGSATEETRAAMGLRALENLRAIVRGEQPPDRVA